jgi:hypothetical protein
MLVTIKIVGRTGNCFISHRGKGDIMFRKILSFCCVFFTLILFTFSCSPGGTPSTPYPSTQGSALNVSTNQPCAGISLTPVSTMANGTIPATAETTISPAAVQTTVNGNIPATHPDSPVMGRFEISPFPEPGKKFECVLNLEVRRIWEGLWQNQTSDVLVDSKAWISISRAGIHGSYSEARNFTEVPREEVVLSCNTVWEGNALETRSIELKSTLCLPGDGIWLIEGDFAGSTDNIRRPSLLHWSHYFAIDDGIALKYKSDAMKSSPLAYLEHFSYGRSGLLPFEEQNPLILELDISHPPLAGEEVTLTYKALCPLFDINDLILKMVFVMRNKNVSITGFSAKDIVVKSELGFSPDVFGNVLWDKWKTSLRMGEPRELSTTIKFPEPGEWNIGISGRGYLPNGKTAYTSDDIKLTISENQSYYGWEEKR